MPIEVLFIHCFCLICQHFGHLSKPSISYFLFISIPYSFVISEQYASSKKHLFYFCYHDAFRNDVISVYSCVHYKSVCNYMTSVFSFFSQISAHISLF